MAATQLPEELLLQVFGLLDSSTLQQVVSLVCSRWYRVSSDHSLLSSLVLPAVAHPSIFCNRSHSQQLLSLSIDISQFADFCKTRELPRLEELHIQGHVRDLFVLIVEVSENCRVLKSLTFSSAIIKELKHLPEIHIKLPKLRKVSGDLRVESSVSASLCCIELSKLAAHIPDMDISIKISMIIHQEQVRQVVSDLKDVSFLKPPRWSVCSNTHAQVIDELEPYPTRRWVVKLEHSVVDGQFFSLKACFPNLEKLTLSFYDLEPCYGIVSSNCFRNLRELSCMFRRKIPHDTLLMHILLHLPHLQIVSLTFCDLRNRRFLETHMNSLTLISCSLSSSTLDSMPETLRSIRIVSCDWIGSPTKPPTTTSGTKRKVYLKSLQLERSPQQLIDYLASEDSVLSLKYVTSQYLKMYALRDAKDESVQEQRLDKLQLNPPHQLLAASFLPVHIVCFPRILRSVHLLKVPTSSLLELLELCVLHRETCVLQELCLDHCYGKNCSFEDCVQMLAQLPQLRHFLFEATFLLTKELCDVEELLQDLILHIKCKLDKFFHQECWMPAKQFANQCEEMYLKMTLKSTCITV